MCHHTRVVWSELIVNYISNVGFHNFTCRKSTNLVRDFIKQLFIYIHIYNLVYEHSSKMSNLLEKHLFTVPRYLLVWLITDYLLVAIQSNYNIMFVKTAAKTQLIAHKSKDF